MSTANETVEIIYVDGSNDYSYEPNDGMTLRDWFAGQASENDVEAFAPQTVGEAAKLLGIEVNQYRAEHSQIIRVRAKFAYADAMLAARARKEGAQ